MELFSQLFDQDLILTNLQCTSKYEFFDDISLFLNEKGYVTANFKEALISREEKYPTGLRTEPYHVAIPHTDPENIIKPFIAMIRPEQKIEFFEMGTDDQTVQAQLIFVLGLKKGGSQVALLQKLIDMFMNKDVMDQLLIETEKTQILSILETSVA
ncbi:PTS sugar transporter subunit IIA [Neobacillus cucumis]|uniref:PTS sugar transporter subunit IIA n=1 Tax=Neobacillus cucumis TaxID=1740721 RepID=UPI0020409053|nr:PTS sugar transporter subunit IIA [Neobacillus cucumis]MCM3726589.1 PTS sugar transporter subunit IIA [Neobacillus cucumis]